MKNPHRCGVKLKPKKATGLTMNDLKDINKAFERFAAKRGMATGARAWRLGQCNT